MGKKNIKSIKIMSVCLVTVLMASLFLIGGVSGTDTDSNLSLANDNRIDYTEIKPLYPVDDYRIVYADNDALYLTDDFKTNYMENNGSESVGSSPTRGTYAPKTGYLEWGGGVVGIYGLSATFDGRRGENYPAFYPALEVKCAPAWVIDDMKMTAIGEKPNGAPLSGMNFGDPRHLIGPDQSGYAWGDAMLFIYNALLVLDPTGLSPYLTLGQQADGGMFQPFVINDVRTSTSAYTHFTGQMGYEKQRNYQFGFNLDCAQNLPGVYRIEVYYEITLKLGLAGSTATSKVTYCEIFLYEYMSLPTRGYASSVTTFADVSGGAYVKNAGNITGLLCDGQFGELYSGSFGNKAMVIAEMTNLDYPNNYLYGYLYIYGYNAKSIGSSHILVYGSKDNVNWVKIFESDEIYNRYPYHIACGYVGSSNSFKYISVVAFNDDAVSNICIDSIGVYS